MKALQKFCLNVTKCNK